MTALRPCTRQDAYRADVTYGTNNEFGFDYLRDNMRFTLDELVQRELHYAIVDEVDSILIDEARTPLIISGPADESTELYYKLDRIIPRLKRAATIVEGKLSERSEEHTSELQSHHDLVCRLLLEKKKKKKNKIGRHYSIDMN